MKRLLCFLLAATLGLQAAESFPSPLLPVRGFCIQAPSRSRLDEFIKFIEEDLAPRSVNVLILRVDYGFRFASPHELADAAGLSKENAALISAACKRHGIRVGPLLNLLGHHS